MGAPGDADARKLAEGMARAREARDRLNDLARRLERLEQQERSRTQSQQGQQGQRGQQQGQNAQQGQRGGRPSQGGGDGRDGDVARLREEYAREIERARELSEELRRSAPDSGMGGSTPEQHEYSESAPGREAFKNDFSGWERLRKDVELALERREAAIAEKLAGKRSQDRLAVGAADGVPEEYRALVAKYFESLARTTSTPPRPKP
jgi:TolA-binding protein